MKKNKELKIFHGLVNYGSQAGYLAAGLRELGYNAESFTEIDPFNRPSDNPFKRKKSIFAKLVFYYIFYPARKVKCFFKFDIFHFYFGRTLFKNQIDLYFYKLFGKKVIMEYLGNDIRPHAYISKRFNLPIDHPFNKNSGTHDFRVGKRILFENRFCDLQLVCLPIYVKYAEIYGAKVQGVLNLAITIPSYVDYPKISDKLIVMHAPTSRRFKGTDYFKEAIKRMQSQNIEIELIILENLNHEELLNRIKECHIFCDQISEGWYGTVALEAMALAKPTLAFIDWEAVEDSNIKVNSPVINVNPDTVFETLMELNERKKELKQIGLNSREYVIENHDITKICRQLESYYKDFIF